MAKYQDQLEMLDKYFAKEEQTQYTLFS